MTYENLLEKCEELGVIVKEAPLKSAKGRCKGNRIAISKYLNTNNERKCVLAEELGHYKLTVGNILDETKIENKKQELKARRYGYKLIVKPNDIIKAFRNGALNLYDVAEYLEITSSALIEILEDLKKQYGIGCRVGNYYLQLEPSLGIYEDFGGLFCE